MQVSKVLYNENNETRNNNVSNLGDGKSEKNRLFNRLFIKRIRQRKF